MRPRAFRVHQRSPDVDQKAGRHPDSQDLPRAGRLQRESSPPRIPVRQAHPDDRAGTAIDRDVIIAGWDLDPNWDARVEEHYYEAFKQSFSRYIFTIRIQKPPLSVILKVMVPALAMLFTGFLALLIQTEESKASRVVNRITISTSALTATILFYVNLTTSIPPVGYLTFADRFMIINIVALSGVVASSAMLLLLEDRAEDATIHRWHRVFMGLVPASWVGMQAVNWLAR